MDQKDFDANERIAGFSLLVKRAIQFLGMKQEQSDAKHVSTVLGCGLEQARQVLERLEQRGLIERTAGRNRWRTTPLGNKLAYSWHPPRTFRPAIRHGTEAFVVSEHCADAPCWIWRSSSDEEVMFEEAELHVAMNPEYEGERLIEVEVVQLDEYQGESGGGGESALAVHVSPSDARALAAGLMKAADHAERELEQRAKKRARRGSKKSRPA